MAERVRDSTVMEGDWDLGDRGQRGDSSWGDWTVGDLANIKWVHIGRGRGTCWADRGGTGGAEWD